jgi:hypothetical protein
MHKAGFSLAAKCFFFVHGKFSACSYALSMRDQALSWIIPEGYKQRHAALRGLVKGFGVC